MLQDSKMCVDIHSSYLTDGNQWIYGTLQSPNNQRVPSWTNLKKEKERNVLLTICLWQIKKDLWDVDQLDGCLFIRVNGNQITLSVGVNVIMRKHQYHTNDIRERDSDINTIMLFLNFPLAPSSSASSSSPSSSSSCLTKNFWKLNWNWAWRVMSSSIWNEKGCISNNSWSSFWLVVSLSFCFYRIWIRWRSCVFCQMMFVSLPKILNVPDHDFDDVCHCREFKI